MIILRVYESYAGRDLRRVTHAGITREVAGVPTAVWGMDGEDREMVLDRAHAELKKALAEEGR